MENQTVKEKRGWWRKVSGEKEGEPATSAPTAKVFMEKDSAEKKKAAGIHVNAGDAFATSTTPVVRGVTNAAAVDFSHLQQTMQRERDRLGGSASAQYSRTVGSVRDLAQLHEGATAGNDKVKLRGGGVLSRNRPGSM